MPSLDISYFPHIWDTIINNLDNASKLNVRAVCSALKSAIDEDLVGDWLSFKIKRGTMVVNGHWGPGPPMAAMPSFSPWSLQGNAMQQFAVRNAKDFDFQIPSEPWIVDLLQKGMDPESYIIISHNESALWSAGRLVSNSPFRFPPCHGIDLFLDLPCPCSTCHPEGPWESSASEVKFYVTFLEGDFDAEEDRTCEITQHFLTSTVKRLSLHLEGTPEQVMSAIDLIIFANGMGQLDIGTIEVEVTYETEYGGFSERFLTDHLYNILLDIGFQDEKILNIEGW